jgi:hypothetical protein
MDVQMNDTAKRAQSIVGTNNDGGRPENDFYPTPPIGTRGLLKVEKFAGAIWECACGDGAMSRVLESAGYDVISTDLEPRGYGTQLDFLLTDKLLAPNIITNPPFKHSQLFITRGLALGAQKLAFLEKLTFLETKDRTVWLQTTPLKNVWVFMERLKMTRNGEKETKSNGGMIAFAWFVWERGYTGRPMIGWI